MCRGKPCRWWVPSLHGSLISMPGSAEAHEEDLSDGPGDQSIDVSEPRKRRAQPEKGKNNSVRTGITGTSMVEPELQRKQLLRPGSPGEEMAMLVLGRPGPLLAAAGRSQPEPPITGRDHADLSQERGCSSPWMEPRARSDYPGPGSCLTEAASVLLGEYLSRICFE